MPAAGRSIENGSIENCPMGDTLHRKKCVINEFSTSPELKEVILGLDA